MAVIEKNNEEITEEEIRVEQEPEGIPDNVEVVEEGMEEEVTEQSNFAAN